MLPPYTIQELKEAVISSTVRIYWIYTFYISQNKYADKSNILFISHRANNITKSLQTKIRQMNQNVAK